MGAGRAGVSPSSAGSQQLLQVISALNLIRMNLGMYPAGHSRITESIDHAFEMMQKILRGKTELFIGFAGDSLTFGETASEKEKKHAAFQEYARCLNHLRIVSFTLHRGLRKADLLEFNRILSAKPADIWALGKMESVFTRAGITGIKVKVIDADHFRLGEKKEILQTRVDQKIKDENFWQDFFARLKLEAAKQSQGGGIPADQENIDPAEAIRALNKQREQWPSAVFSYEKMVRDHLSEAPAGRPVDDEKVGLLTSVNSLVGGLHPELKKQLIDVVERQITLHPETWVLTESLRCFPHDLFKEILRQTNERGAQISPALVNLLKKMSDTQEMPALPDRAPDKDFSSKDIETLLKREDYENYVPDDYDRLLKKASETSTSKADSDESRFPLHEYLKTLTYERVDFRICQLLHSLMDEEIAEEDYLACSRKLGRSLPELLTAGQFAFLAALLETLRRHAHDKPAEQVRQKAQSLLKPLLEKETVARCATPFILERNRGSRRIDAISHLRRRAEPLLAFRSVPRSEDASVADVHGDHQRLWRKRDRRGPEASSRSGFAFDHPLADADPRNGRQVRCVIPEKPLSTCGLAGEEGGHQDAHRI